MRAERHLNSSRLWALTCARGRRQLYMWNERRDAFRVSSDLSFAVLATVLSAFEGISSSLIPPDLCTDKVSFDTTVTSADQDSRVQLFSYAADLLLLATACRCLLLSLNIRRVASFGGSWRRRLPLLLQSKALALFESWLKASDGARSIS